MKKLNDQSGFTIIELVLSFVFVFTIAFSMYQLVFNYKEKRDQESLSAMMTDYKNEVTLAVQRDINDRILKRIDYCTNGSEVIEKCLVLYFNDGTKKQLSVESEKVEYEGEEFNTNYIKYGGVNYKNDESFLTEFKSNYMLYRTYDDENLGKNTTIYKIAIPIYHNDLGDEDFGIYITAIGYNYDSTKVDGDGPGGGVAVQDSNGRIFDSENHMKCITSVFSKSDLYKQSMIIRFKTGDNINKIKGKQLLSNLNGSGSALSINNGGHICYNAYLKSTETNKPTIYGLCSSDTVTTNTWYNVIGGFESNSNASNTDEVGFNLYLSVNNGYPMHISFSLPGSNYRISGSNLNYTIGAEPGSAINLAFFDGIVQDVALYNGISPNPISTYASGLGTGTIKTKIETTFGTTGKVFHYDFTDTSVYANYCLD